MNVSSFKSTTYSCECLYHICYKKSLSPWVTGSLYISNTENTEAMQWAKIWESLELKQHLTSKIAPKSSWNADYYFIIRKFPNQHRFDCFPIMPDFADMRKYLRDLRVCKSCLFFCLFQREQGLEQTWDWYQATFFQLICMILLFRSPCVVLRKEGWPLQV